ncbi:DUF5989 family protein [Sphingomonas sp. BIUV-7]|uniref:DUF5989 family protein n=1 Tax=Sphingomonas natans TaxID=3063330 RepID=A0ABT8YBW4_9SPHN|nr:DUF5989 family protein [Sphingomonas sp. BIUV-7]MDO6415833.1 DUF5989 family protein [Sphingomonas sp. BIUV-7]
MKKTSAVRNFASRASTIGQLIGHFSSGRRIFMLPILLLILVASLLLMLAGGLSYVAPFVYAIV